MQHFVATILFFARNRAEAERRTRDERRMWMALRAFQMNPREFEELWPGLERILEEGEADGTNQIKS